MMRSAVLAILVAVPALPAAWLQASAQPVASTGTPTCMVREGGVRSATGRGFMIVVPASEVPALETRGFVVARCDGRSSQFGYYRKQICSFAQQAPSSAQARFLEVRGISAAELCALAQRSETAQ